MSKNLEKLRKNIKNAIGLNEYFSSKGYQNNEYLDVFCTLLAFDLDDEGINNEMLDHIPKLVRQIKNELNFLQEFLEKEDKNE